MNHACYCWLCRAALLLIALKAPCADLSLACQQRAHTAGQGKGKVGSQAHTQQQTLEACIAALLFAAHPIHTEAVAGIVGHAELLSAALALLALMAYMSAASKAEWGKHYQMLAVSVLMLFLAALAKEIGITMVQHSPLSISVCSMIPVRILCHTYAQLLDCAVVLAMLHRASQLPRHLTPTVALWGILPQLRTHIHLRASCASSYRDTPYGSLHQCLTSTQCGVNRPVPWS